MALSRGHRSMYLYARLADDNGNPLGYDYKYRGSFTDTAGQGKLLDWKYKALDELKLRDRSIKSHAFIGNMNLKYEINNHLNIEGSAQYQRNSTVDRTFNNVKTFFARDLVNRFTKIDGNTVINNVPVGGILDLQNEMLESYSLRGQANFNKIWHDKHRVVAIAGAEVREVKINSDLNRTYGFDDKLNSSAIDYVNYYPTYFGGSERIPYSQGFTMTKDRAVSLYTNAYYTFDNRYTVSASLRRDATNIFGVATNSKWKPFWSSGINWKISNEKFYQSSFMPSLSLRASIGYNGNVNNAIPALTTIMYLPGSFNFTNLPSAIISNPANPDLRWEKVRTINIGVDFSLKNNRLNGSIEVYQKNSYDVIGLQPMDRTTGLANLNANSANLSGKGIDISLNATIIKSNSFNWTGNLNFSMAKYKVTKFLSKNSQINSGFVSNGLRIESVPLVGYNPYSIVSFKFMGLDPSNGDPLGYINKKISKNYDSIVLNSPIENQVIHGPGVPTIFGNFLNTFMWKNISVSPNITYCLDYYFRRSTVSYPGIYSNFGYNTHSDYNRRWTKAGDEKITDIPSLVYPFVSNRDYFYSVSEATVEKGDYVVLDDIRVTYGIQHLPFVKSSQSTLNLFFNVGNLNWMIWKASSYDPRYLSSFSPSKTYSFGLNLNF